jgi:class 3 adenylate cyclase/pimeloyl-ACP methyl ester carboxylesterase
MVYARIGAHNALMEPEVRYCITEDGVSIAYAVTGAGPDTPLLLGPSAPFSHVLGAVSGAMPGFQAGGVSLAAISKSRPVATFDFRGCGLSDRKVDDLSMEALERDLYAVVERLGWERFALCGMGMTGPIVMKYAAEHPERVSSLVLRETYARAAEMGRIPRMRALGAVLREDWESYLILMAHTMSGGDLATKEILAEMSTLELIRAFAAATPTYNATEFVSRIVARTLVLGRDDMPVPSGDMLRQLGARIRDARVVMVKGGAAGLQASSEIIEAFVAEGDAPEPQPPTRSSSEGGASAVVLFTDIVDSTALTERMGDARFRDASRSLDTGLRAAIRDAGGAAIDGKLLGDGVLATFPSAAQALDGAQRCLALSAASELGLHIGLHAGDVIREDNNVYGGAVNIAARICGLSAPGEILVSDVVRGMARSSAGVTFEDRGAQEMKGVGEPVRVYAVLSRA